jgi:hypothetical protein
MLKKVDEKTLKFFQKISDWFQLWLGISNFALAKFLLIVSAFSFLSESIERFFGNTWDFFNVLAICIAVILTLGIWIEIDSSERSCRNNPVFSNPSVIKLSFWRLISLFGFTLAILAFIVYILTFVLNSPLTKEKHAFLADVYHHLYKAVFFMSVYFASCTPRPPSRSKIRKMIEGTSGATRPSPLHV